MKRIRALTREGRKARTGLISLETELFGVHRIWIPPRGDHRHWMNLAIVTREMSQLEMKSAEIGSIANVSMFINGKLI